MSTLVSDKIRNLETPLGGEKVYLNFAGDSGLAVTDRSGKGHVATVVEGSGVHTFSDLSPVGGKYLGMAGNQDGYIKIIPSANMNYSGAFSVMGWVYIDSDIGYGGLLSLIEPSGLDPFDPPVVKYIDIEVGGHLLSKITFTTRMGVLGPSGSISQDAWHHIACVSSGLDLYIYVDGVLVSSGTTTSQNIFTYSSGDIPHGIYPHLGYIGLGNGGYIPDRVADFAFFTRALTASEVRFSYERCNDLVNYIPWLIKEYWALQHTPFFTSGWVDPTADLDRGDWINFAPMPGMATPGNLEENLRRHDPKLQVDIWTNKGRARADLNMREIDRIFTAYRRTPHHSKIERVSWTEPLDMGSEKQGFQRYSFDVTGLRWSIQ